MKKTFVTALLAARIGLAGVDFDRDVHPILAAHCFACHGGDKRSRRLVALQLPGNPEGREERQNSEPRIEQGQPAGAARARRRCLADAAGGRAAERIGRRGAARVDRRGSAAPEGCACRAAQLDSADRARKPVVPDGPAPNPVDNFLLAYFRATALSRRRRSPMPRSRGALTWMPGACCPRRNNWTPSPLRAIRASVTRWLAACSPTKTTTPSTGSASGTTCCATTKASTTPGARKSITGWLLPFARSRTCRTTSSCRSC